MSSFFLSAFQIAGDTVTAPSSSDARTVRAKDHSGSDHQEPLPVEPPNDDDLQAALEDLAAAHSHAQAAADSQSIDVLQSA
jgi:hypothetical protein